MGFGKGFWSSPVSRPVGGVISGKLVKTAKTTKNPKPNPMEMPKITENHCFSMIFRDFPGFVGKSRSP